MTALAQRLNSTVQGLSRIIDQYQKPNILGLVKPWLDQLQKVEDALWEVATLRYIDTAEGVQLDVIGIIINQPRDPAWDDPAYRIALRARLLIDFSCGTEPEIQQIGSLCLPPGFIFATHTEGIGTLIVQIESTLDFDPIALRKLLPLARAGGVRIIFRYHLTDRAGLFTFKRTNTPFSAQGFDAGKLQGSESL